MIIREGLEDSSMVMFAEFKDQIAALVDLGIEVGMAATVVAMRERTSVLDHRLDNLNDSLIALDRTISYKD